MTNLQQLCLFCLLWCLGCWRAADASPFDRWEDGIAFRKVLGRRSDDLQDSLWRDQNKNPEQEIFKRFLFHYAKAHNAVGAVEHTSDSVHPLMRLSPKLAERKKKKVLLLSIRALPDGCCGI